MGGLSRFQYDFGLLGGTGSSACSAGGYYSVCRVVCADAVRPSMGPDYLNLPEIEFVLTPECRRRMMDFWCYPDVASISFDRMEEIDVLGEVTEGKYTYLAWRWYFLGADRKSEYILLRYWKVGEQPTGVCYRWLFDLCSDRAVFNANIPTLQVAMSTGQVSRTMYIRVKDGWGSQED